MAHYGLVVNNLQTEVATLRQDIITLHPLSLSDQQQQQQQKNQHLPFGPMRPPHTHLPPRKWWPFKQPVFFAQQPLMYGKNSGQGDGNLYGQNPGKSDGNLARDSNWSGPSGGGLSGSGNPARDSDWSGPSGGGF